MTVLKKLAALPPGAIIGAVVLAFLLIRTAIDYGFISTNFPNKEYVDTGDQASVQAVLKEVKPQLDDIQGGFAGLSLKDLAASRCEHPAFKEPGEVDDLWQEKLALFKLKKGKDYIYQDCAK